MTEPICIEVLRGKAVESVHLVDAVVMDVSGKEIQSFGEHDREIYPRSSIKALQALPLIESGAADAFGFEAKHLALACASHNGEAIHEKTATEMLMKAGLKATCLECGAQVPSLPETVSQLARKGRQIEAIHNNCSGKHSGFLAFAKHVGLDEKGYVKLNHPVQREIASTLQNVTGAIHAADNHAIDGCSIPTYRLPMPVLATAFARFGVGQNHETTRAKAMIRLRDACFEHPEMVAGTGRVCTRIMNTIPGRAFVKVGAEGVYVASLPEIGAGIALKARDGNPRAAEVAVSWLIVSLLCLSKEENQEMFDLGEPVLKNWNGIETGSMRVANVLPRQVL